MKEDRERKNELGSNVEKGMDDLVHSSISSLGILEFPSIRTNTGWKRHVSYVVVAR